MSSSQLCIHRYGTVISKAIYQMAVIYLLHISNLSRINIHLPSTADTCKPTTFHIPFPGVWSHPFSLGKDIPLSLSAVPHSNIQWRHLRRSPAVDISMPPPPPVGGAEETQHKCLSGWLMPISGLILARTDVANWRYRRWISGLILAPDRCRELKIPKLD